jgi:hypothetical protein
MTTKLTRAALLAVVVLTAAAVATTAHGQAAGPQAPPPTFEVKRIPSEPHPGPPPIPEQEIIQKFAANEDIIKKAYDTYTFTQTIRMSELTDPGGEFSVSGEVYMKSDGQRYVRVVGQPNSTLKVTHFSLEDVRQIASVPLFPLTSQELANYNFKYAGEQKLDQLNTYVFQVKPKTLSRKKRFFEGVVWVDDHDFAIVKSYGKFVSELSGNGLALPFTMFETYRENVQDKYWFPSYIRSDDFFKPNENQNQPAVPAKGRQRNGVPVQEDDPTIADKPATATEPDEQIPLRLIVRSTGFKVQDDVPAAAPASSTAAAPPPKP